MIKTVPPSAVVAKAALDPGFQRGSGQGDQHSGHHPEDGAHPAAHRNLRLAIETDASGDGFVYRLVDPRTGEVVAEISREDLRRLSQAASYRAGAVVSTEA